MREECNAWDQMIEEPDLWYGRFTKFRHFGVKRTVAAVYRKENHVKPRQTTLKIPGDWYEAAKTWRWEERARAYYDHVTKEEDAVIEEEQKKVIRSGLALRHKRIQVLQRLANKLIKMTDDENKIWLAKTKTTTYGEESTQVVEEVVFNAPLFMVIDRYLRSIADEMGERVKKKDMGVASGESEFEIELVGKSIDEDEE